MFAFALWDTLNETLFLARDRCGERSLVYYLDKEKFIFSSEIKTIVPLLPRKPELEPAVVDLYLHYQYTPEPFTLLQGIQKLPAAHTLTITRDLKKAELRRYWCVEDTPVISGLPTDTSGILHNIREAFEESVKLILRTNETVAVGLSGGIDSSIIATLARKNISGPMHAISVGYPGRPPYDERNQAKELAEKLGIIFHEVELPVNRFVDFFPELVNIMDEPVADPAAFGHYTVSKAARDHGFKILLSGIGGDELFWGYEWVAKAAIINQNSLFTSKILINLLKTFLPFRMRKRVKKYINMDLTTPDGFFHFLDLTPDFCYAKLNLSYLYGSTMNNLSSLNAYRPIDIGKRSKEQIPAAVIRMLFDTWLIGNCLNLSNFVSVDTGVESRLPFLEPKFINLVMALRRNLPDHKLGQKAWLRAAFKNVLPDEVLSRSKRGFQPPVQEWLNGVVEHYGNILLDGQLKSQGILENISIDNLLKKKNESWNNLFIAYKLVLLENWVNTVYDR